MAFQDKSLSCKDCGKDFTWSASEQEFYQEKGFQNAPVRCPECRAAKKARMEGGRGPREQHEITCSNCGKKDSVPFKPRGDRPVLCGDCFRKQKDGELVLDQDKEEAPKEEPKAEEAEAPAEEKSEEEPKEDSNPSEDKLEDEAEEAKE